MKLKKKKQMDLYKVVDVYWHPRQGLKMPIVQQKNGN